MRAAWCLTGGSPFRGLSKIVFYLQGVCKTRFFNNMPPDDTAKLLKVDNPAGGHENKKFFSSVFDGMAPDEKSLKAINNWATASENGNHVSFGFHSMSLDDLLKQYTAFDNQVAGHKSIKGFPCLLIDKRGLVLKYVEQPARENGEENFYVQVFSREELAPMRKFVPKYYGSVRAVADDTMCRYLQLQNLLEGMQNPSIIDLKIGKVTFSPTASKEKERKELLKNPFRESVGFSIPGTKVYNLKTKKYDVHRKLGMNPSTGINSLESYEASLVGHLERFFGLSKNGPIVHEDRGCDGDRSPSSTIIRELCMVHLMQHILEDLRALQDWMLKNWTVKLYSSSILIAYDSHFVERLLGATSETDGDVACVPESSHARAESFGVSDCSFGRAPFDGSPANDAHTCGYESRKLLENGCENQCGAVWKDQRFHVPYTLRMIDFCHAFFDYDNTRPDENYLFGLRNLMRFVQNLASSAIVRLPATDVVK